MMSAEAKAKRLSASAIAWEEKYTEFKRCVEMRKEGTPLYNWQKNQLSNTHASCLNTKILKDIEENEGMLVVLSKRIARRSVMRGRGSTVSSNHTTGCQRKEPCYIIGKRIS